MPKKLCKNCVFLRTSIIVENTNPMLVTRYGNYVNPCNRYPMNIMRAPTEPGCGEFKPMKGDKS